MRFAGQRRRCLCTESIYQAIYDPAVDVTRPTRRRRRRRRFLILLHLPGGVSTADAVRHAIGTAFAMLPDGLRRTLTWDQGKELALHQQITAQTGTSVFFCDAHSPWQRGSNENTDGLLRDYFPKGTDLSVFDAEELQRVAVEINARPRKTLSWSRPGDLFSTALAEA